MLSERVDPSEVELCSEIAKKAEKEASDAKSKVIKLKDVVASMNVSSKLCKLTSRR
jgi:histone H3/H4